MRSNPNAASTSHTSSVVVARPPSEPRVAIDRMKTPGSRLTASMRIRSPSSAPPLNGTRRIHRDDCNLQARAAILLDQLLGEGALAGAGRSGDADAPRGGATGALVHVLEHALEPVPLVLDEADGPGERGGVAAVEAVEHER